MVPENVQKGKETVTKKNISWPRDILKIELKLYGELTRKPTG